MKQLVGIFLAFVAVGLVVGCGGDDDDKSSSGTTFNSSLPDSKELGTLTDAEGTQFCKDLETYGRAYEAESRDSTCLFSAVSSAGIMAAFNAAATDAELQKTCKSTYDACLKAPAKSTSTCSKPSSACTATVSDFETCLSDAKTGFQQMIASLPSCNSINKDTFKSSGSGDTNTKPSAACTTLQEKCAELSTETDDGDIDNEVPGD